MTEFILEPGSLLKVLGCPSSQDSPAITCFRGNASRETATYSQLYNAVAQLCDDLQLRHQRELLMVVCGTMSLGSIALLLAALHSNAYYYIQPDLIAQQSTNYIVSCLAPALVAVDHTCCMDRVSWLETDFSYVKKVNVFDSQFHIYAPIKYEQFNSNVNLRGLAYVITTSGSTGSPKIVLAPRSCVAPNIGDLILKFKLTDKDVIFNAAPLSFDPSIVNILMSLYSAAHLLVASKEMVPSVRIVSCLLSIGVTVLQMTPSLLRLWHRQKDLSECLLKEDSSVRVLALGGEPAPMAFLKSLCKYLTSVDVYSLYGITEVSSWSSIKKLSFKCATSNERLGTSVVMRQNALGNFLTSEAKLDLGEVLSETSFCLIKDGSVCEDDFEGEIYLGRKNCCMIFELVNTGETFDKVSKGIALNEPQLKLIQSNVVYNGTEMYPSGDLGYTKNKLFYFKSRKNREVKIFGQRLNLFFLENACISVPNVTACRFTCDSNNLFCFYSTDVGEQVTIEVAIRNIILNVTRVPCSTHCLPRLPLNSHGKVDDKQLMKKMWGINSRIRNGKSFLELIEKLWFEFCRSEPRPDSSFTASGLDSLRAVEFLQRLQQKINVNFLAALDVLLNGNYRTVVEVLKSLLYTSSEDAHDHKSDNFKDVPAKKLKVLPDNFFASVILSKLRMLIDGLETPIEEQTFPSDAQLVWTLNLDKCIDASPVLALQSNNCSEPLLFIGSHSSQFCCVGALSGAVKWKAKLESRMEASPAVNSSATRVYAACYAGVLYCFNVSSGDLLWKFKAEAEIKCSPIVDYETGNILFGSHDKYFYCVKPDGTLAWKARHSGGSIFASPCISSVVFVACLKGTVGCYEKDSGERMWQQNLNAPVFASLVRFCEGVLCVTVDKRLTALSSSGCVLWCYELRDQCYCTPRVLRLPQQELICLGDNSGTVHLISTSGRALNCFDLGGRIVATPYLYLCRGVLMAVVASTTGKIVFCKFDEEKRQSQNPLYEKNVIGESVSTENPSICENCNNCTLVAAVSALDNQSISENFSDGYDKKQAKETAPQVGARFLWSSSSVYELSYPGEIFSSPLVYQNNLFICGRENTVRCYKF